MLVSNLGSIWNMESNLVLFNTCTLIPIDDVSIFIATQILIHSWKIRKALKFPTATSQKQLLNHYFTHKKLLDVMIVKNYLRNITTAVNSVHHIQTFVSQIDLKYSLTYYL